MKLQDLNNLSLGNAGSWPVPAKAGAILLLCAVVLGAGYWFDTKGQLERLTAAEEQEVQKRQAFEAKRQK